MTFYGDLSLFSDVADELNAFFTVLNDAVDLKFVMFLNVLAEKHVLGNVVVCTPFVRSSLGHC